MLGLHLSASAHVSLPSQWAEESAPQTPYARQPWASVGQDLMPNLSVPVPVPESEGRVQLVVPGSCEGSQDASVGAGSFCFHCPACWEQELGILLQVVRCSLI